MGGCGCGWGIIQRRWPNNWGFGVVKSTRLSEKMVVEFCAEFFNA
jgi:hypothetical protein